MFHVSLITYTFISYSLSLLSVSHALSLRVIWARRQERVCVLYMIQWMYAALNEHEERGCAHVQSACPMHRTRAIYLGDTVIINEWDMKCFFFYMD